MIWQHWLSLYVAVAIIVAAMRNVLHRGEDVILALVFTPLLAAGFVAKCITWLLSAKMRKAMRGPTLADVGGRAAAKRTLTDITQP